MLSVIKHAMDTVCPFGNTAHPRTTYSLCNTVSCCTAKLHFFDIYGPSSPEMNSTDYITRLMESYSIVSMGCKSAILKKSCSNWLYSGKPFEGCDFCVSMFPR